MDAKLPSSALTVCVRSSALRHLTSVPAAMVRSCGLGPVLVIVTTCVSWSAETRAARGIAVASGGRMSEHKRTSEDQRVGGTRIAATPLDG